jgi:GNAT superfamily N-acetyltransferase
MEIVQFQKNHAADVVSLWNDAVTAQGEDVEQYTLSEERLQEIMEDGKFLPAGAVVAESSGRLAGFARGYVEPEPGYKKDELRACPGQLAAVVVHPDYRGQGIGRALAERVEAALKGEGQSVVDFCLGLALDSGPYHFLLACGYRPLAHILGLRNDLSRFQLDEEVKQLRARLEAEGITFRWYERSDHDHLLQFWAQYFPFWYDPTDMDLYPDIKFLLALSEGRIVGFIGSFYTPGEKGYFGSPGVHPDFRRRGIGTVLLHLGLDYLKSEGVRYTPYSTHADNPARFMYLSSGAEFTGVHCGWFRKKLQ